MDRYVDPTPPGPDDPDAFRFASPGKLLDVLIAAGVVAPSERVLRFTIQAPISVEEFLALRLEMSEKLREKIASLSGDQINEVKREMLGALGEYRTDRGMSFPAEVLIVSGTKSST